MEDDGKETPARMTSCPSHSPLPFREDCWSEDATYTLIEAWGDRYLELNRGNLRQKHWQEDPFRLLRLLRRFLWPCESKRSSPAFAVDDWFFRRNYSAAAAADLDDSESSRSSSESRQRDGKVDGFGQLAQAIVRLGKVYEKVERAKQRQMIELEKKRKQFAKDLEFQRMQLLMDTQVQLEEIKRAKKVAAAGERIP
ncbi:hypothetical protein HHK36_001737 [Tetracentron sinense]|uniref:Trihelix transcription factor ASIL2 n=1 Tax=Tetracentron sinense TaxID=13715 RepID=A0A834ZTB5_TETSI|nr:hypothetical protein HHK36_001737 [Tetracentron sinense]